MSATNDNAQEDASPSPPEAKPKSSWTRSFLSGSSASLEHDSEDIISAIVYDGHPNRDEDGRRTSSTTTTTTTNNDDDPLLAPTLRDHYLPHPPRHRKHHVLVKVHAVGLNPVDAKEVVGDKLPHSWTWMKTRLVRSQLLHHRRLGFDFSGVVAEDANAQFPRGTKVFGTMPPLHGSCAEYLSAPIDQLCVMPSNYSFEQAAALPLVGLTALQSLQPHVDDKNNKKSSVLIIGASGGTGHVAVQVARNLGARHITALCSARNQEFVQGLGATHVVDYHDDDIRAALQSAPGCPFDIVLDCVTSADPRDQRQDYPTLLRNNGNTEQPSSSSLVSPHHMYLRLGGHSSDWIRAGMERVLGVQFQWRDKHEKLFWIRLPHSADELQQLKTRAEQGQLVVQVAKTVPFTAHAVQAAMEELLQRRVQGKLVVQVVGGDEQQGGKQNNAGVAGSC